VQFRAPDHRVTQRRDFETQREAEGFAATVHVPKMRGEYVDPADVRVTVGDLGPAWLARRRRLKPSSRRVEEVAWMPPRVVLSRHTVLGTSFPAHAVAGVKWEDGLGCPLMGERLIKKLITAATALALLLAAEPPHASGDTFDLTVDSKPMHLSAAPVPYAFSIPAKSVYRFEVHANDFGWPGDSTRDNRRSELVSTGVKYGSGTTLWTSFSFVVGAAHAPFDGGSKHNTIHQWHSVDTTVPRSPVVDVELLDGDGGN
jgi:hypothetical protein